MSLHNTIQDKTVLEMIIDVLQKAAQREAQRRAMRLRVALLRAMSLGLSAKFRHVDRVRWSALLGVTSFSG
jgi:hypothetical protein